MAGVMSKQKKSIKAGRQSLLPIAVDFGVTALKILQLTGPTPASLVAAATIPTPEPLLYDATKRFEFQLAELPKAIKRSKFKGKRIACVLPSSFTFCKHMQYARQEGITTRVLLEAALAQEFDCSPDAFVTRHREVEVPKRTGGQHEAICMAVPRGVVDSLMAALRGARLMPVGLHSEPMALVKAFSSLAQEHVADGESTLYLDIGWSHTAAVIAHGSELVFARTIEHGGRHFDEAVMHQLKYTFAEASAERLGMESLTPRDEPAPTDAPADEGMALLNAGQAKAARPASASKPHRTADLSEPLEILTDELSMCLRYHESLFPTQRAKRVVFVGGESRHRALCEQIARRLRLPAVLADPMASVGRTGKEPALGMDLSSPQPGWAAALGASLSPTDL